MGSRFLDGDGIGWNCLDMFYGSCSDLMWGYDQLSYWSILSFVGYFRFHWSNPPSLPFSFLSSLLSAPIKPRSTLGHSKVASLSRSSCAQVRLWCSYRNMMYFLPFLSVLTKYNIFTPSVVYRLPWIRIASSFILITSHIIKFFLLLRLGYHATFPAMTFCSYLVAVRIVNNFAMAFSEWTRPNVVCSIFLVCSDEKIRNPSGLLQV